MKLTVLMDNNTIIDRYFIGEPGLSFLIETEGKKILLDTGYSDGFLKNAIKMGESLLDLDTLCLSHGHIDHTWGLAPLYMYFVEAEMEGRKKTKPTLLAHEKAFWAKEEGSEHIGSLLTKEALENSFEVHCENAPVWLTERLVYLGEIERTNDFENQRPIGETTVAGTGEKEQDFLWDDTALAYKSKDGLVIITGCSHSGICNIVKHAKKVCGENRISDIIGGFHLLEASQEIMRKTTDQLKQEGVKTMHPCHCTDLMAKIELSKSFEVHEVGVGLEKHYE